MVEHKSTLGSAVSGRAQNICDCSGAVQQILRGADAEDPKSLLEFVHCLADESVVALSLAINPRRSV